MGEYFNWVNVDKREYLCPGDFDLGNKLYESAGANNALLQALCALLTDDWRGDRLIWLGDYAEIPADTENAALKCLAAQHAAWLEAEGVSEPVDTFIMCAYRNVSALFREAEIHVRPDIARMVDNNDFSDNEYGVDPADPWKGLFARSGRPYRFAVNRSKREFLASERERQGVECRDSCWHSCLPVLFACGGTVNEPYAGHWIGDRLSLSDEPPDGYRDMSGIYGFA